MLQLCLILLCFLGAFLTVSRPYLLILTVVKAFFDVAVLSAVIGLLKNRTAVLLRFNACLLYILLSFVLFCFAACGACLFSHMNSERNLRLICSRPFLRYLGEALLLLLPAVALYLIWPSLMALYV